MVDVTVGEGNAHGHHVQHVDAGSDLPLVPSRIDYDAFFLGAGVDITICLPRPYDYSLNHDIVEPKGLRAVYQYRI